ncbi:MAG TPA: 4Fe-4S dicluster domain-containing protein [Desulfobacteraceae bacterium]|nr:MAG: hypothetical protein DRH24_04015 [Deltaproteobacteria bacterium]HDL08328.1 4Fe-4S dicluster domain-containing protein [Desulfobacteraceae bacterium]
MDKDIPTSSYVDFDKDRCIACVHCVRSCPTKSIRIKGGKSVHLVDHCIGCGECIRVCPTGAVSAVTSKLASPEKEEISVALVSPVLFAQFPGIMPAEVLQGLKQMGFQHVVDMSYFLELFLCAAEEYIIRNRTTRKSPWPLISPVCPVVVRLIAFKFPSLLPNILPIIRPLALMVREVKQLIARQYGVKEKSVAQYYINPCPTMLAPSRTSIKQKRLYVGRALGINDVYAELNRQIEKIKSSDAPHFQKDLFDHGTTGSSLIWCLSGGEIANMNIEHALAVSGLKETITYLEKIEMGLFKNIEYIEFRTCPEGCLGGTLTAIDKYLAKSVVQKMIIKCGIKKRVSRKDMLQSYEEGWFLPETSTLRLERLFGEEKEPLSIDSLHKIEKILAMIKGKDCSACGAPDCKTFAEDVVRGKASLNDCLVIRARGKRVTPETSD